MQVTMEKNLNSEYNKEKKSGALQSVQRRYRSGYKEKK